MRTAIIAIAGMALCGGVALATLHDDPDPESVSVHVQNAAGAPMAGIRVAVWTPAMTTAEETPVAVTNASGDAEFVVPGTLVRPNAYAIIPGDEAALLSGWKQVWKGQFLASATAITLSDSGTTNAVTVAGHETVTLACAAATSPGRSSRGMTSTVVGSLFSGNIIRTDETLHAEGIPKNQPCSIIVENKAVSLWIDVPVESTAQDGPGPTIPEATQPTGEAVRLTLTRMAAIHMPPSWKRGTSINLIRADGSVCYSFNVYSDGTTRGEWSRDTQSAPNTIHLPQGEYFVVPGMVPTVSITAQRTWKALRNGRAAELATAGLQTITVVATAQGQEHQQFTVDAKTALEEVIDHVGLAD